MKKDGFTMIELLAVFTLTGIILLIALPQLTSMLKKTNDEEYQTFLNNIYIATEAYIEDKQIQISSGSTVAIQQLIQSGFLKSTLVNPKNNKTVSDSSNINKIIKITKNENNILEYSFTNDTASPYTGELTSNNWKATYDNGQMTKCVYLYNNTSYDSCTDSTCKQTGLTGCTGDPTVNYYYNYRVTNTNTYSCTKYQLVYHYTNHYSGVVTSKTEEYDDLETCKKSEEQYSGRLISSCSSLNTTCTTTTYSDYYSTKGGNMLESYWKVN